VIITSKQNAKKPLNKTVGLPSKVEAGLKCQPGTFDVKPFLRKQAQ